MPFEACDKVKEDRSERKKKIVDKHNKLRASPL